jgi:SAM-dependent methyltransferase
LHCELKPASAEYQAYLDVQLRRTLSKRDNSLPARARRLIDKTAELIDLSRCSVLCVGCRNAAEIEYFRQKGAKSVVGIDLYSKSPDVLVMDMHAMKFEDDQFDVVYSSHSLEHSLRPEVVIRELVRIARNGGIIVIEVPVNFGDGRGIENIDFQSVENLLTRFGDHVSRVLWQEIGLPGELGIGEAVIRLIFIVGK